MARAINLFFMGKGGVGKSSCSALNAVSLAESGHKVLLVSLDPAHNLSDIFSLKLNHKPTKILPGLKAIEIDQNRWIKAYLKDIQRQVKKTYSYLSAFNLDHYFKIIRHSPGLEEYALLMAFRYFVDHYSDYDFLVFDMPPTALAVKFFGLPSLSLIWIEQLYSLRKEIIDKRELITRIRLLNKEMERDKVLRRINELRSECQDVRDIFQDRTWTRIHLVMNSDELSHAESRRIVDDLADLDISIDYIIHNKMQPHVPCSFNSATFTDIPVLEFPCSESPLIGMDALQRFLDADHARVRSQLHACHMPLKSFARPD
ncbi:MAG TPA: ArsA family ATPase [Deltaproteobacteria bacterium]|nr:ArsA family ATPase [Deltaproteobacteria bacterium]